MKYLHLLNHKICISMVICWGNKKLANALEKRETCFLSIGYGHINWVASSWLFACVVFFSSLFASAVPSLFHTISLSRLVVISLSISLSFSVTSKVFLASRFFSASSFDMSVGFNRSLMHKNNTIDDVQTISKISINVTNDCNARRFYNIDNIIFMSSYSF